MITPFNDILANYNTHKSKIEPGGECYGEGTAMFDAIQQLSVSELATLKENNAQYAALLSTDYGEAFEANAGNADIIRLYATLASPPVSGSASGDGASGAAVAPPTVPRQGINCLMAGEPVPSTDAEELEVLNCLVFGTPRSFWVTQSEKTLTNNDLATRERYSFLGLGDWVCTHAVPNLPDHPFEPSCVKHDVAYGSLQKFVGTPNADDKDSTWKQISC